MYRPPGNGFGDNRQQINTQGYAQQISAAGEWGTQPQQQTAYQTQSTGWGYGTAQPSYGVQEGNWTETVATDSRTFAVPGRGGRSAGFGGESWAGRQSNEGSMLIEVPSQEIRRIIGRGGTKIRELEQGSGCRIKINKERDNGVTAGIELVGSEDAQSAAQQMISDVVASSQSGGFGNGQSSFGRSQGGFGGSRGGFSGRSDFGGEGTLEMEIANRDVARVIGRGGSKIRELQDESSTRIQINKDRDNGVTTVVEIRGSEEGQQRAKQLIEDLTANQNSYDDGFRNDDSRQGRGGFGGRNDWAGDSLEIEVPSKDVARIIGKGGSKIQEMQDKSGTRIKINKDRDDGVMTVVQIRGSKEGQQMAKQLIEALG